MEAVIPPVTRGLFDTYFEVSYMTKSFESTGQNAAKVATVRSKQAAIRCFAVPGIGGILRPAVGFG